MTEDADRRICMVPPARAISKKILNSHSEMESNLPQFGIQ